jgi:hypothetical protein
MMAITDSRVRRGSLKLQGDTPGTWVDFSCQPTAVAITPGSEEGTAEKVEVLCGDTTSDAAGATRTATLDITAIQDFTDGDGLVAYAFVFDGETRGFQFNPTGDAQDLWEGTVVVHAIPAGGEVAARLSNTISWEVRSLKLPPRIAAVGSTDPWFIGSGAVQPTGATAGTPGAFTPAGAAVPADLNALKAITPPVVASPATAWTTGQSVTLGTGEAHWSGTDWVAGAAS